MAKPHALADRIKQRFGVSRTDLPSFTVSGFTFRFRLLSPGDVQWASTVATTLAGSMTARRVIVRHILALAAVVRIADESDGLDGAPWQVFLPTGEDQKDEVLRRMLDAAAANPGNPPLQIRLAGVRAMYDFFAGTEDTDGMSETIVRAIDQFYSTTIFPLSTQPAVVHQCPVCNSVALLTPRDKPRYCEECGGFDSAAVELKPMQVVEAAKESPLDVAEEAVSEA